MKRRVGGRQVRDLEDAAHGADLPDEPPRELTWAVETHWGDHALSDRGTLPDTVLDDFLEDLP